MVFSSRGHQYDTSTTPLYDDTTRLLLQSSGDSVGHAHRLDAATARDPPGKAPSTNAPRSPRVPFPGAAEPPAEKHGVRLLDGRSVLSSSVDLAQERFHHEGHRFRPVAGSVIGEEAFLYRGVEIARPVIARRSQEGALKLGCRVAVAHAQQFLTSANPPHATAPSP